MQPASPYCEIWHIYGTRLKAFHPFSVWITPFSGKKGPRSGGGWGREGVAYTFPSGKDTKSPTRCVSSGKGEIEGFEHLFKPLHLLVREISTNNDAYYRIPYYRNTGNTGFNKDSGGPKHVRRWAKTRKAVGQNTWKSLNAVGQNTWKTFFSSGGCELHALGINQGIIQPDGRGLKHVRWAKTNVERWAKTRA